MLPDRLIPLALFLSVAVFGSALVFAYDLLTGRFDRVRRSLAARHASPATPAPRRLLAAFVLGGALTRGNVLVVSTRRLPLRHLTAPLRLALLLFGRVIVFVDDDTSPEFLEVLAGKRFVRCVLVRDALGRYSTRANELIARSSLKSRDGALLYVDTPVRRAHRPVTAARVTTSN